MAYIYLEFQCNLHFYNLFQEIVRYRLFRPSIKYTDYCELGLRGIVAKRMYNSGIEKSWQM